MKLSSVRKRNPNEFPLYVYIGKGDDKDMRLVAKLPHSAWIPRMGERLVIPILDLENKVAGSHLLKVELVVHDLVGEVVNVFCEGLKVLKNGGFRSDDATGSSVDIWYEMDAQFSNQFSKGREVVLPSPTPADLESMFNLLESASDVDDELRALRDSIIPPSRRGDDEGLRATDQELVDLRRQLDEL